MTSIFFRYFPLFAYFLTPISSILNWQRFNKFVSDDPGSEIHHQRFFWGYNIVWTIIWAPMLIGIFIGDVPTMLHFFVRGSGNPYITAYWIVLIILWVAGFTWIFFFKGTDFLINNYWPIIAKRSRSIPFSLNPLVLKIFYVLGLLLIIFVYFFGLPNDIVVVNDLLLEAP